MKKTYINADELLLDSFKLARKIYDSGFRPDFIVGVWRGGTPVAIAIQEYFDYIGHPSNHIAIRTSSYTGIDQQTKNVSVLGLEYLINNLKRENHLLFIDDVFDTGKSIQAILTAIKGAMGSNCPEEIRVATPWFKPSRNTTDLVPDFYLKETNDWLVFPHELSGLDKDDLQEGKAEVLALLPEKHLA